MDAYNIMVMIVLKQKTIRR